jgi:hypothetical protein
MRVYLHAISFSHMLSCSNDDRQLLHSFHAAAIAATAVTSLPHPHQSSLDLLSIPGLDWVSLSGFL